MIFTRRTIQKKSKDSSIDPFLNIAEIKLSIFAFCLPVNQTDRGGTRRLFFRPFIIYISEMVRIAPYKQAPSLKSLSCKPSTSEGKVRDERPQNAV